MAPSELGISLGNRRAVSSVCPRSFLVEAPGVPTRGVRVVRTRRADAVSLSCHQHLGEQCLFSGDYEGVWDGELGQAGVPPPPVRPLTPRGKRLFSY